MEKTFIYNSKAVKPSTIWLLFLLCGWSYGSLVKRGKQILLYVTFGGCGLWCLYRLFTLSSAIKEYNRSIALQAGLTTEEMAVLGIL